MLNQKPRERPVTGKWFRLQIPVFREAKAIFGIVCAEAGSGLL